MKNDEIQYENEQEMDQIATKLLMAREEIEALLYDNNLIGPQNKKSLLLVSFILEDLENYIANQ